jgi:hypothetical protein
MRGPIWLPGASLALIVALAGCGPGESPPEPAPPSDLPAAEPPAPASEPQAEPLRSKPPDPEVVGVEATLPDDVPLPPGATPVHPPLRTSETTRATFEVAEPVTAVQGFYKTGLAGAGWTVEAEKELPSQGLISAKKEARELSVAMSETAGRTQFVILVIGE